MFSLDAFVILGAGALLALAAGLWPFRAYVRAGGAKGPALVAVGVATVLTVGVYFGVGRPGLPGAAYYARIASIAARFRADPAHSNLTREEALALWQDIARRKPADPQPLMHAGAILMEARDFERAARTFDAALRRAPQDAAIMTALGEAEVSRDGSVTPEALALFEDASRRAPNEPLPVLFQALAASEEGRKADALRLWARLSALLPQDDPRQAMAAQMRAEAAKP